MAVGSDGRVGSGRADELAEAVLAGATSADLDAEVAESLRALAAERDVLRRMDREAATHVESVIALRTDFTGDAPYVGWRGLGLSLGEALDERDALRAAAGAAFAPVPEAYGGLDLSRAQQLGLEAMAAVRAFPASGPDGDGGDAAVETERRALASVLAGDGGRDGAAVRDLAAFVGRRVAAVLASRGIA